MPPTMAAVCEAVCDLYGLAGCADDDLRGALLLVAFADKEAEMMAAAADTKAAEDGEAATEAERMPSEAAQQKLYYANSPPAQKDEGSAHTWEQLRTKLQMNADRCADRSAWGQLLGRSGQGDEVWTIAVTLLLGLLYPDALAKVTSEKGGNQNQVLEIANNTINPQNRNAFDAFVKKMRTQRTDHRGTCSDRRLAILSNSWRSGHESHRLCVVRRQIIQQRLCDTMKYYGMAAQTEQKKAQYKEMGEELEVAKRVVAEAEAASGLNNGYGDVSATQIKAVQEEASQTGTNAPTSWVRWALQRTSGDEQAATALLVAQPEARLALAALRNPGTSLMAKQEELSMISPHTVRREDEPANRMYACWRIVWRRQIR